MANNRNQHFVPKAYLRPFGDASGAAINLYAIKSQTLVAGASIKGQCSRNYFYGNNEVFEEFIRHFEGEFGRTISRLINGEIAPKDIDTLFRFFVLQHLRTPHMLANRLDVFDAFRNTIIGGKPLHETMEEAKLPADLRREMQEQIYIAARGNDLFHDLCPVILFNATDTPFIASDNPACLTNKLYSQRYREETSGFIQSGAAIVLPLNSWLTFLAYDGDVFKKFNSSVIHEIRNPRDVDRLNELQVQYATETIFFSNWADREYITKLYRRCEAMRRDNWSHVWTAIKFEEDAIFEKYRTATEADNESTEPRLTSVSMYNPAPLVWPSFLKFQMRPTGFTTGSAVGYVRAAHAQRETGRTFRQEVLPPSLPKAHTKKGREIMWMRKEARDRR